MCSVLQAYNQALNMFSGIVNRNKKYFRICRGRKAPFIIGIFVLFCFVANLGAEYLSFSSFSISVQVGFFHTLYFISNRPERSSKTSPK